MATYGDKVNFVEDPYEAAKDADAIAIMTEWNLYKSLDYKKIYDGMRKPAHLFDGRDIIDLVRLHEIGFDAHAIGIK